MFIGATGTDVDTANERTLGSSQKDALQNITGFTPYTVFGSGGAGAFGGGHDIGLRALAFVGEANNIGRILFDASLVARTSIETRAQNTALFPRIYR